MRGNEYLWTILEGWSFVSRLRFLADYCSVEQELDPDKRLQRMRDTCDYLAWLIEVRP